MLTVTSSVSGLMFPASDLPPQQLQPLVELGVQRDDCSGEEANPRAGEDLASDKPHQPDGQHVEEHGREPHRKEPAEERLVRRQAVGERLVGVVERRILGDRVRAGAVLALVRGDALELA